MGLNLALSVIVAFLLIAPLAVESYRTLRLLVECHRWPHVEEDDA